MEQRLRIEAGACILLAALLLVLPLNWLIAAAMAAVFHELCHYAAARMMGIRIIGFTVGANGCLLSTEPMGMRQEVLCAAAGPVGSLFMVLLIRWFPRLAICAAIQGLYNLLPIYPLDGGRILRCALSLLIRDDSVERICSWTERVICVLILVLGFLSTFCLELGFLPLLFGLILTGKVLKAKNTLQTCATQGTIDLPFVKR